ncbi:hypothetical protein ACIOWE_15350 [Pseudomonas sp. NPDC087598]|uniref:hypothetical protein n=1 Tax=Pseudomonas sp. NPDC087598 TaxID=3364440 RepID=UPI003809A5CF
MIPAIFFIGPMGGVDWDNTQTMVRNNWQAVCGLMTKLGVPVATFVGQRQFESAFNWDAFKCEGQCGARALPLDCAQIDHRIPQASLNGSFLYTLGSMLPVFVGNTCQMNYKNSRGPLGRDGLRTNWKVFDEGKILVAPHQVDCRIVEANYTYNPISRKITVSFPITTGITATAKEFDLIEVLRNDITNVRPLCPPCNGARNANPNIF